MGSVVKPHITVVYLSVGIAMLCCDVFIQLQLLELLYCTALHSITIGVLFPLSLYPISHTISQMLSCLSFTLNPTPQALVQSVLTKPQLTSFQLWLQSVLFLPLFFFSLLWPSSLSSCCAPVSLTLKLVACVLCVCVCVCVCVCTCL